MTFAVGMTKARISPVNRPPTRFARGVHTVQWAPAATIPPRTYLVRLRVGGASYGAAVPTRGRQTGPVVRVQSMEATFVRDSYRSRSVARLRVSTDADELTVQLFPPRPEFWPQPAQP